MILGTGSDIIDISRIEKSIARFGNRFLQRIFTETEQHKAQSRAKSGPRIVAATYAKRFAAKEACSKALGTGFNSGVYWRDIEVTNQPGGAPTLRLTGGAGKRLFSLTPKGFRPAIHLTMTDEYPYAQAYVIIEAEPHVA